MERFEIIKTAGAFRSWRPFLESWHELNERCVNHTDGAYAPFAYRERTNVGILAASAIKHDWVALEEYKTKKNILGERLEYDGRADLFLIHKLKSKNTLFEVEAKLIRKNIISENGNQHEIVLFKANKAAEACRPDERHDYIEHKVALSFIVPFVPFKNKATAPKFCDFQKEVGLSVLIDKITQKKPELFASSFTNQGCELLVGKTQEPKYGFGIIIIGNIVETYSRA